MSDKGRWQWGAGEQKPEPRPITRLAGALIAGLLLSTAGQAAESNAVDTLGGTLRLVPGGVENGVARLGLAIDLKPGWHTYWRYPGDSGVPPEIVLTDPKVAKRFTVLYPGPKRFGDSGDQTIGYDGAVVLPITVQLTDQTKPTDVSVTVRLGVCRNICVPIDETLSLLVDPKVQPESADVGIIDKAVLAIPQPVAPGGDLSVSSLIRDPSGKPEQVTFTVKGPTNQLTDVFVEGPDGWALPLPSRVSGNTSESIWRFALDGLPAGAKAPGTALTFTMVGTDPAGGTKATTQSLVLP